MQRLSSVAWRASLPVLAPAAAAQGQGRGEVGERYGATWQSDYRFIEDPGTRLSAQAGIGYRASRLAPPTGETDCKMILRGGVKFEHESSGATTVVDTPVVESGAENLFASNDLALQVRMTGRFALSLALGLRYHSNPPPALRKTDALTTVNLVHSF